MKGVETIETVLPGKKGASAPAKSGSASKTTAWIVFIIAGAITLGADLGTKYWARHTLPVSPAGCDIPGDFIKRTCGGTDVTIIDGFWDWRLAFNNGAAFSMFGGSRIFLTLVGIVALGFIFLMMKKSKPHQRWLHMALGMVVGGAIGNLADRIYFGVVTDFISWHYKNKFHWPVFNIADVALVIGIVILFFFSGEKKKVAPAT